MIRQWQAWGGKQTLPTVPVDGIFFKQEEEVMKQIVLAIDDRNELGAEATR